MALPLEGVRVVELSLAIAAPSAGQVLSDYGAEVVKVEPPVGDSQRWMISGLGIVNQDPYKNSPHFYSVNRGKRSVVLDLKTEAGMTAMHRLLDGADVFLSNYRLAAMRGLGLGPEEVLAKHPQLVICPMTGWGFAGPDAEKPVYDVAGFWARSGAAAVHTGKDGYPAVLAPGFGDMATGLAAVGGICAALFSRSRTGRGRILTTNLMRVGLHCNAWSMSSYFAFSKVLRWGQRDKTANPLATVYKAKDEKAFWIIGFESARHWPTTVKAVERPEWLEDPRFKKPADRRKNEKELVGELDAIFATKPLAEWAQKFDELGLWWAPVQDASEVAADAQALADGAFLDSPVSAAARAAGRERVRMVSAPVDFLASDGALGAAKAGPRRPTPELGEHTEEVVQELNLDEATRKAVLAAFAAAQAQLRSRL